MKLSFSFILLFINLCISAQTVNRILGAHVNAGNNVFSTIYIDADLYNQVSILNTSVGLIPGETTLDENNSRYFMKTGSRILVINSITGSVTDSITNVAAFHN